MNPTDNLQIISDRLYRENIASAPLDSRSLELIEYYMTLTETGSDLTRRLSNIEINFAQINAEAEEAQASVLSAKNAVSYYLRKLTDTWEERGILREFAFSYSDEDCEFIRSSFTAYFEAIRTQMRIISDGLITLGETAAQIRACSASSMEIYQETRLAIYAAMLNHDIDNVLDCRGTSLLAHASAVECERISSQYLGSTRKCTRIISIINNTISEVSSTLKLDDARSFKINIISPMRAANQIFDAITALDAITFEDH